MKPATPEATPAAEVAAPSEGVIIQDMGAREELRRSALEKHGMEQLKEAQKSERNGDFKNAVKLYEESLKYITDRPEMKAQRKKARDGLASSFYGWADDLRRQRDFDQAAEKARTALVHGHPDAQKLLQRIDKEKSAKAVTGPVAEERRWDEPQYKQQEATIDQLLKRGRQQMLVGEYDSARQSFESVLASDPENTEAIRMMTKMGNKKYDRATMELEATRADMMADVRKTWNPRDYGLSSTVAGGEMQAPVAKPIGMDERGKILKKMENIRIPELDFRQANINDVVAFLQEASVEYDTTSGANERKGVNIILHLGETRAAAPTGDQKKDVFAEAIGGNATGGAEIPLITFSARDITLLEALKLVAKVANLKYRIEGSVVMIVPANAPEGEILIRMYNVLPTVVERFRAMHQELGKGAKQGADFNAPAVEAGGGGNEGAEWKDLLGGMGMKWPEGSSISYVGSIGKLVVANTADNLTVFEQILSVLNVVPSQIEIESRFVEVAQTDLDALGFEWLLNDNWEMAYRAGQTGPLGGQQRIEMPANAVGGGFTRGMRFAGGLPVPAGGTAITDDILHIRSVLTNPELELALHALQQSGHADLLSAPKVTTKSGSEASIKVVTEYIYPTSYDIQPGTQAQNNGVLGNAVAAPVGPIVTPQDFQTREVGVILTVMPEVSPEGQMINLTMTPEVVSEPDWHDYGYDVQVGNATQHIPLNQPFFHTRTVSTSIQIYNNATVVMGGMITEKRTDANDKIPFLGDVPLVGRLFRSKYDSSEKRNLLIFVTARLVDPAGRPLKKPEDGGMPMIKTSNASP